jgi:hypothetical protein
MQRKTLTRLSLAGSLAALAFGLGTPATVSAHWVQAPCDFITAGGFVKKDNGQHANFGAHGGCKNGQFWGHVNFVDHEQNYHISSTEITGYLFDPDRPNTRDICGWARTNDEDVVQFRVSMTDNGEPGRSDTFGIVLDRAGSPHVGDRFYRLSSRPLEGGNVQLHKGNRSNSASDAMLNMKEWQMCGDLAPSP